MGSEDTIEQALSQHDPPMAGWWGEVVSVFSSCNLVKLSAVVTVTNKSVCISMLTDKQTDRQTHRQTDR